MKLCMSNVLKVSFLTYYHPAAFASYQLWCKIIHLPECRIKQSEKQETFKFFLSKQIAEYIRMVPDESAGKILS